MKIPLFTLLIVTSCLVSSCSEYSASLPEPVADSLHRDIADKLGTRFFPAEERHFSAPQLKQLDLAFHQGGDAIWGATGRDDSGNIYFGVSGSDANSTNNAYLYQYNPTTQALVSQGNAVEQLNRAGIAAPGLGQNKLHSKIVQADDGYLYFSTFDEQGENAKQGTLPTFGGNLWRKRPADTQWQHLLSTKEALIAVNTDGRKVYALGYWGHVLYQFDTSNQQTNRVQVSEHAQHISRNFLVSLDGHVFVPKINRADDGTASSVLVEYDQNLVLVNQHIMNHYLTEGTTGGHGIIGFTATEDGYIFFTTATGALYQLSQYNGREYQLAFVEFVGGANDPAYTPSLFTLDGTNLLVGLGRRSGKNSKQVWYIRELANNISVSYEVSVPTKGLFYGSVTRDNKGALYVVGRASTNAGKQPMVLQLVYE